MYNNSFFKQVLFVAVIIIFASCDKDYNEIGADLIGENNFALKDTTFAVVAYNQKIGAIQSNNLPVNALGIYDNPAFGTTTASFVTQVSLSTVNPTIGKNPVVESVVLTIPYFSTLKTTNADGSHVYELDSIYGASGGKIKLSIYESGYFMRDLDPVGGFQNAQKYYTDQNADFDYNIKPILYYKDDFFFDPAEHVVTSTDVITNVVTTTRTAPAMRLKLDDVFFKTKIIEAQSGKLSTNEAFKEYFRGLYFKVEKANGSEGSLAMMDFSKGVITITYKEDISTTDPTRVGKSIVLNLSGNTVSLLEQSNTKQAYSSAMSTANTTLGDERLYLKGGEGSMAVISLFGADNFGVDGMTGSPNGVADELDIIRKNGWLINEANLVFNIDASAMANSYEPQRIYLYDLNNKRPVMDYYTDVSTGTSAKKTKAIFDGNLNLDATSKRGLTYKIRITNQIRNLIKYSDSTNVKMGVVVTEDINTPTSSKWRTPKTATTIMPQIPNYTVVMPKWPDFSVETPRASVMNPLGTILYGSKSTVPEDKRLKLEIYYTKPN